MSIGTAAFTLAVSCGLLYEVELEVEDVMTIIELLSSLGLLLFETLKALCALVVKMVENRIIVGLV